MNKDINNVVEENLDNSTNQDYISALNDMKKNSVSKAEYERVKTENKQLLNSLVNGETITADVVEKKDVNELRERLFGETNLSNMDYVKTALDLREALLDAGEPDPFLPQGHQVQPSLQDEATAERVAGVMYEALERADGDAASFTAHLQSAIAPDVYSGNRQRKGR